MTAFLLAVPRGAPALALERAEALMRRAFGSVAEHASPGLSESGAPTPRWIGAPGGAYDDSRLLVLVDGHPELVERVPGLAATSQPVDARGIAARWQLGDCAMHGELTDAYAVAVWDGTQQCVVLETDAFGLASLFYRVTDDAVLVCTEVAPLLAVGAPTSLDLDALPDMLVTRFLASSRTAWTGVRQVTQGTRLRIDMDGAVRTLHRHRFAFDGMPPSPSMADAVVRTRAAVRAPLERMRDRGVSEVVVPLSGGVDSSVLAGLAVQVFPTCHAVTFSIDDFPNPELARAQEVARRLGLTLRVVRVTKADVERLYPWIIERLQEPPLHYNNPALVRMFEQIRELAPDVLSGDFASMFGADTLPMVQRLLARKQRVAWVPRPVRGMLASVLDASTDQRLGRAARLLRHSVPEIVQRSRTLAMTDEAARAVPAAATYGAPSEEFVREVYDHELPLPDAAQLWVMRAVTNPLARRNARFADPMGLRVHCPLLDVAARDVAATLPSEQRWEPVRGKSKPALRAICAELVGDDVADWPKLGFPSPELAWMEGPLLDRLNASLADDAPLAPHIDLQALRALPRAANQQTLWTVMTLDEVLRQGAALMTEGQPA